MERQLIRVMQALYCEPWLIRPEIHQHLCAIAAAHISGDAHAPEGIATSFETRPRAQNKVDITNGIAVVNVRGVIGRRFSGFLNSSGVTSIDVLQGIIEDAIEDDTVDAVVMDIDSPGGTVTGVPEAATAIEELAKVKPVVAWSGGLMASAAFWIATPCDGIFCTQSAHIGSVGVYTAFLDRTRQLEEMGIGVELFKTGKFKAMGLPGVPLTDEQRTLLQEGVDEVFAWFKAAVTGNRRVADGALEGQTFFGRDAVEVGLADGIKELHEAVDFARGLIGQKRQ